MPSQLSPHTALSYFKPEAGHDPDLAQSERRCLSRLAEFLLLNRLRARTRGDLVADMLERAASVIEVTSRHWFAASVSAVGFGRAARRAALQATQDEARTHALDHASDQALSPVSRPALSPALKQAPSQGPAPASAPSGPDADQLA